MADMLTDSFNSTFFGIPTIAVIFFIIVIFIIFYKFKKKPKEFKKISAKESLYNSYKERLNAMGTDKHLLKLYYGYEFKGYIGRTAIKGETLIIEVHSKKWLSGRLKRLFNWKPKYYIVPNNALIKSNNTLTIDPVCTYDNYLGTIIFEKSSREKVEDELYKVNSENALEELINWLPLQSYLSVQHTQSSESLDHIAEIEKAKKDEAIHVMTGKSK